MTVRQKRLSEMAERLGWKLVKLRSFKYGVIAARYVLKDEQALLYFSTLDEVERRLVTRRQQAITHVRARLG